MRLSCEAGDITNPCELPYSRVVCLDAETTGLNPHLDEVLQLALVRGDGEVLASRYVRPLHHRSWPAAQRVHGISPSMVRDCLPLMAYASEFEELLSDADLIVGYNISFDLAFLQAAGISHGHAAVFDVMREFAPIAGRWDAERRRYTWVPLSYCARFYGIPFRAHDALEDARTTLGCFWAMLNMVNER